MSQLSIIGSLFSSRNSIGQSVPSPLISLIQKFTQISNSINIDIKKDSLRIFESAFSKHKDDPNTQLKNIENKSEMNRAQIELFAQRRPKIYSLKSKRYDQQSNEFKYINIYKQYQKQQKKTQKVDTDITSQDEFFQSNTNIPPGIKHYSQLKNHPKVLQYTLNKIKSKNLDLIKEKAKQQQKRVIKNGSKPDSLYENQDYRQLIQYDKNQIVDKLQSPQVIVQNQLTKFYSRSNKSKLETKLKDNPRCNRFLQRQEKIILNDENRLSKENMKKLKDRLNVIVNEIEKDDRKSKDRFKQQLPKLSTNRYSFEDSRSTFYGGSHLHKN